MEKKAKRFVRLLARKLTGPECENERKKAQGLGKDSGEITQAFKRALNDLPGSDLKTELQANPATYVRKLEKLMQHPSNGATVSETQTLPPDPPGPSPRGSETVRPGSAAGGEPNGVALATKPVAGATEDELAGREEAAAGGRPGWAYNAYGANAKSGVTRALAELEPVTRKRLAPHAYAALGSTTSYSEFLQLLQSNGKHEGLSGSALDHLKEEILASLGTTDDKIFTRCLADCLSGIIVSADRAFDFENMDRVKELREFITNFLLWAKIQHGARSIKLATQADAPTNFDDLLAAMLSIYIDLCLHIARGRPENAEADGQVTLCKVLLLIGHSPLHQLNLLLQVTLPTSQDSHFMMPIYRHMLNRIPDPLTNEIFIKYICAVRFSKDVLQRDQPQLLQDILNVARTAEPSKDFLQWLFNISAEAYGQLPDAVKIRKVPLVKYLAEQAPKDYLDKLLDIVSDEENESGSLSPEDGADGQSQPLGSTSDREARDVLDAAGPGGLFFTDTGRDEDLARQVESDSESVEALHDKLDALMEDIEFEESGLLNDLAEPGREGRDDQIDDHEELEMDTSPVSGESKPETMSFEELKQLARQEKVEEKEGGDPEDGSRRLAPDSAADDSDAESNRESFTTARDNLDSTKESIVIDSEVTFMVKSRRAKGAGEEEAAVAESRDDGRAALDGEVLIISSEDSERGDSDPKAARSPASVEGQEPATDEGTQRRHLRSTDGPGQSSLLRFFSPVCRTPGGADEEEAAEGSEKEEGVDIVPDSCDSAGEREEDGRPGGDEADTASWRAGSPEALPAIGGNSQASKRPSDGHPARLLLLSRLTASARVRPSRARKLRPSSTSSEGSYVDPSALLPASPVIAPVGGRGPAVQDAVAEGIRRIRQECGPTPRDLQEPLLTRSASKLKSSAKRTSLTITGGARSSNPGTGTPGRPSKPAGEAATPASKPATAERKQGVSPLSPGKVKRAATFGDTYRLLAGLSADSQTDAGSLPASQPQSQPRPPQATPKRQRLQPKALGGAFSDAAATTPSRRRQPSGRKGSEDAVPLSSSSQESPKSGLERDSSTAQRQQPPKKSSASQSSQKTPAAGQKTKAKTPKTAKVEESSARKSMGDDSGSKASLKRRASLPASKSTKSSVKMRKSTGGKM